MVRSRIIHWRIVEVRGSDTNTDIKKTLKSLYCKKYGGGSFHILGFIDCGLFPTNRPRDSSPPRPTVPKLQIPAPLFGGIARSLQGCLPWLLYPEWLVNAIRHEEACWLRTNLLIRLLLIVVYKYQSVSSKKGHHENLVFLSNECAEVEFT